MRRDRIESAVKLSRRAAGWLLCLYVAGQVLTGCALYKVDRLIDDSNAAIVSTVLTQGMVRLDLEGGAPVDAQRAQEIQTAVDDINVFIQENQDKPRLVNALQVRKGLMLLNAGSPNLARAAFAHVERDQLSSQRDRAIYDIHDPLVWLYGVSRRSLVPADFPKVDEHLDTLAKAGNAIERVDGRPPLIRYRVEQMRVRIALRAARPGGSRAAGYLEDGLSRYGAQFDETDRAQLLSLCKKEFDQVDAAAVSWLGYVPRAFEEGATSWTESALRSDPPPLPEWWNGMEACRAGG